ncbi:hypothetical protein C8A03DRAFT_14648 [Achaetomium macrosporum]|uniref:Uncharacterized protein n=1 Tax=Achaetomium macrosporum TaxID=79813 RepID=A0AAN7H7M4_9PEZI|nr:hypothetical protein C8A03DRAFT_14648 [Achaetomium macrosporum]
MSSSFNRTCDRTAIPDNFPSIPTNLTYVVIPGQNTSDPWMVTCCQPYPVQLVDSCWEWCEISPDIAHNKSADDISDDFSFCLVVNNRDLNKSASLMVHISPAPLQGRRASWIGCMLVSLAVSVVVAAL